MTTPTDSSPDQKPTVEAHEDRGSELGGAPGSADRGRKVMVALGVLCIAIFSACVIAIGFYVHVVAGLAVTATVALWIGYSIGQTLKETNGDSSPNNAVSNFEAKTSEKK
jgi:uncharacterized protein (DUF697 family)